MAALSFGPWPSTIELMRVLFLQSKTKNIDLKSYFVKLPFNNKKQEAPP